MSIPRIFVPDKVDPAKPVQLPAQEAYHLVKVLRLAKGDHFELVDGAGVLFLALIEEADPQNATAQITSVQTANSEPKVRVTLVQGLPKGDKLEWVIQKATELGVAEVIPLEVEHAVVKYTGEKAVKKVERWRKIAAEASKQADRLQIPWVTEVKSLPQLADQEEFWEGLHLLASEASSVDLKKTLQEAGRDALPERVVIYIGPEGSFSQSELDLLISHGVQPVSLGPRILRTETAGLALLSMIMYEFDQIIQ